MDVISINRKNGGIYLQLVANSIALGPKCLRLCAGLLEALSRVRLSVKEPFR